MSVKPMKSNQSIEIPEFNWKIHAKKTTRPFYGDAWDKTPCMAFNKNGLVMNEIMVKTFHISAKDFAMFMFDTENKCVGVQIAVTDAERLKGFKIARNSDKSNCLNINNKRISTIFPEVVGKAYEAKMVPNSRIIYIQVD